jgi:hypothetical protein
MESKVAKGRRKQRAGKERRDERERGGGDRRKEKTNMTGTIYGILRDYPRLASYLF